MRPSGRKLDAMRSIEIDTGVTKHAEGSCLIRCGDTHVLCTATIEDKAPPFLKGTGLGWVTAEYGMLPRATNTRNRREAAAGQGWPVTCCPSTTTSGAQIGRAHV